MSQMHSALIDIWIMTKRNVLRYRRIPTLMVFSSIQPIMFLLLFNFVFGGAIAGDSYALFLIPGLMAQTMLFGGTQTSVGLAEDMKSGIIDRFKSLPINNASPILGRAIADGIRNIFVAIIMVSIGYLIGFELLNGVLPAIAGVLLITLFGFVFSWIMILVGLAVKDPESVNTASFLLVFPLSFASNVFVPIASMPGWLQAFVNNQPVTHAVTATRALLVTGEGYDSIWKLAIWMVIILAIFVPLSIRQYKKS